jgi:hypothetical protein
MTGKKRGDMGKKNPMTKPHLLRSMKVIDNNAF